MRINFLGKLVDEPEVRAGFIGCGSHSFRNIYPTFQFAPVNLVATCDLDAEFVLHHTRHVHGFYGASSMERLPAEITIRAQMQKFKAIRFE